MTKFYFDVWASDDVNGTALGELTQAYERTYQRLDQAIGSGQFTINRHDSQFTDGWCAQDNLVRVRLVPGGPFDADDARYVHAFFIEEGDDEAVSSDEEGGEEITRGGRDAVIILQRAVVNYQADDGGTSTYWDKALKDGNVHFLNRNAGEVLRILLRNAAARTPDPLDPSTHDFVIAHDSSGAAWSDTDADWHIPVGKDMLEVLGILAAGDTYWRMGTDLVLHAYDEDPGADVSGSVSFVAGVNIRDAAQRQVHARETISRALVQGTKKDGGLTFRWVVSAATETALGGRREGFVEYQSTPTAARLDKAGLRSIRSRKKQHDGPTTLGVEEQAGDPIAFTDYVPGDSITVDIPGIWDEVTAKVYGVQMDEDDAGDALVTVILEEQPFDPASGDNTDAGLGDGTGNGGCGKCPPPPPFQPGTQPGEPVGAADGSIYICNTVLEDATRNAFGTATGISFVAGETWTYRLRNAVHAAIEWTDALAVSWQMDTPPAAYVLIRAWGVSAYYAGGPDFPGPRPAQPGPPYPIFPNDTGTFVVTATGIGHFQMYAGANYEPGSVTADECWAVDFWRGDVDPDGEPDVTIPPDTGQPVTGETPAISIGSSTTTLTVDWPYAPGSLRIRVDGVIISPASYVETTPGSGVVTLSWALDADETVTVDYQAAT